MKISRTFAFLLLVETGYVSELTKPLAFTAAGYFLVVFGLSFFMLAYFLGKAEGKNGRV